MTEELSNKKNAGWNSIKFGANNFASDLNKPGRHMGKSLASLLQPAEM